jgi:ADP-heptose:LPS heptosyltransferase
MSSPPNVLVFYSRIDAFGDGLLRIPALRAARTAFPDSRIVYASSGPSTLQKLLRRHVDHLVDELRTAIGLEELLTEHRRGGGSIAVLDLRNLLPRQAAMRLKLVGSGIDYDANFPGYALSWPRRRLAPRPEHNAWRYHRLVERLARRPLPFDHRLSVPAAARAEASRLRGEDRRPLVLTNANGGDRQRLSAEQIATITAGLLEMGYRVVHLITPGDGPSAESLRALEERIEIVAPSEALNGGPLDDLFLALGEMASAFIGADGGMPHMLATVMTPIVMINRGFSVERWRPLSNCVEVIEAADVSPGGLVRDTPPAVILAAARKLFAAQSRDHR